MPSYRLALLPEGAMPREVELGVKVRRLAGAKDKACQWGADVARGYIDVMEGRTAVLRARIEGSRVVRWEKLT